MKVEEVFAVDKSWRCFGSNILAGQCTLCRIQCNQGQGVSGWFAGAVSMQCWVSIVSGCLG